MRERLARVVAALQAAADRRAGTEPELVDVLKTLGEDHPTPAPEAPLDDRLAEIAEIFGLDGAATELLAVAVAGELDANLGYAFDLLAGRALAGRVSVALALELCGLPTAADAAAVVLHPSAPLRRGGLLDVVGDAGWLHRSLVVADRVRAFLAGDDGPDTMVVPVAVDAVPFASPVSAELTRALRAGQRLVWLHSPHGTAGVSTAVAGFVEAGADCLVVDVRLAPGPALTETLTACAREAGLRGVGLVVAGAELALSPESGDAPYVLGGSPVPVVAVGTSPWPPYRLARTPLTLVAPYLTGEDRGRVWETTLGAPLLEDSGGARPVTDLRLTPEEILATSRYAERLAEACAEPVTAPLVWEAARILGASATGSLAVGHGGSRSVSTFADLVLPERVEAELVRLVRWAGHRDEVLARGDLHTKGGKGGGLAALFTGSPGTGKTLAAHVVADELGLELMQIDLSAIVDKYVGETEKRLEAVFRDAESRNVVLFFDEADALFGSRSAVQDAHDRYANQEVSYLLQRMEHFDGITVLATNLRGNLDAAFVRRIQFIVHFPDPDEATRRRLWQQHLAQAGGSDPDDPVDVDVLASSIELAGGDIRNIALAAAYDAAVAGQPVGHRLVVAAAVREHHKLGRRVPLNLAIP